jgi:MFS family permease
VLVDHVDRRAAAAIAGLLAAGVSVGLALASDGEVAVFFLAAFLIGLVEGLRIIATQSHVYDVAGSAHATAGMALSSVLGNLGKGVGGVLIGSLLELFGAASCLFVIALAYVAGSALLLFGKQSRASVGTSDRSDRFQEENGVTGARAVAQMQDPGAVASRDMRAWGVAAGMIRSTMSDPNVRWLASIAVITEFFAFSSVALLPILARDVYGVGPSQLGMLNAVRFVGGALGLLVLAWGATRCATLHRGSLLVALSMLFGLMLATLGLTQQYLFALFILFVGGIASGSVDALLQTLLQAATSSRGTAMGIWVWSIGFAPIGGIQVGALASLLGAQLTLGINGSVVAGACALLALLPAMRRLR